MKPTFPTGRVIDSASPAWWSLLRRLVGSLPAALLAMALLATVCAHPGLCDTGVARFNADLVPKILYGDNRDGWTAGIGYDVGYENFGLTAIDLGEFDTLLEARSTGTLTLDSDLNKEGLTSKLLLGASWLTGEAGEDPLLPGHDPNADIADATDRGPQAYVFAGADLRHETDQQLDEQNLALGLEAGFINRKDDHLYGFMPSIIVAFEWVDPFASEFRENLVVDKAGYSRWRLEASLKASFGQYHLKGTFLEPLGLRLDFRYYRSDALDSVLDAAEQDEIVYAAGALTYTHRNPLGPFAVQTFFVKVADGRLPPATQDQTTVAIGVLCPLGKGFNQTLRH